MVIALAGGSWIFLGVVILMVVGVIIGFYTRRGSGMNLHPYRHVHGGAPGSDHPTLRLGHARTASPTPSPTGSTTPSQPSPRISAFTLRAAARFSGDQ